MFEESIPVARGSCTKCGSFLVWEAADMTVWMQETPNKPIAETTCPICKRVVEAEIGYKDVMRFKARGVNIKHVYDSGSDIQPIQESEVDAFLVNMDSELTRLLNEEA